METPKGEGWGTGEKESVRAGEVSAGIGGRNSDRH